MRGRDTWSAWGRSERLLVLEGDLARFYLPTNWPTFGSILARLHLPNIDPAHFKIKWASTLFGQDGHGLPIGGPVHWPPLLLSLTLYLLLLCSLICPLSSLELSLLFNWLNEVAAQNVWIVFLFWVLGAGRGIIQNDRKWLVSFLVVIVQGLCWNFVFQASSHRREDTHTLCINIQKSSAALSMPFAPCPCCVQIWSQRNWKYRLRFYLINSY